jgi:hypothetical protein
MAVLVQPEPSVSLMKIEGTREAREVCYGGSVTASQDPTPGLLLCPHPVLASHRTKFCRDLLQPFGLYLFSIRIPTRS